MKVQSVNVGRVEHRLIDGRRVATAIAKHAVAGPVAVAVSGLAGDEQADPSVHGGLSKAVYAYPVGHYPFWQTVRAQAGAAPWDDVLPAGSLGENLTIEGLDESRLWIGDLLVLPGCTLAVSEPRFPCFKFNAAMGFKHAAKLMAQSGFCGSYLAVHAPGQVQAGDEIELRPGPREVGIRELFMSKLRR
jgi:MOSC domain-containing protein YiiM